MKLNENTSHPSAFISSTFLDLESERQHVAAVLKNAGLNVNALDVKPASTRSSRLEILGGIRESDFLIVIVANRYGSIVPAITRNKHTSVTEWEYDMAVSHGKSVLVYFKKYSTEYFEGGCIREGNAAERGLKRFKEKLERLHSPRYFSSAEELAHLVSRSLISVYREGVRRHFRTARSLEERIAEKDQTIARLEEQIKSSKMVSATRNLRPSIGLVSSPEQPLIAKPEPPVGLSAFNTFPALPTKPLIAPACLGLRGLANPYKQ